MRIVEAVTFGLSFIGSALLSFVVPLLVLLLFLGFSDSVALSPRDGRLAAVIHVMYRLIAIYAAAAVAGSALGSVFKSQEDSPFNYPPLQIGRVAGAVAGGVVAVLVIIATLFGERVTEWIYETISFGLLDL